MREIYGFLRLASRLANPFGHPSQVRTHVLVLQTCVDLRRLASPFGQGLKKKRTTTSQQGTSITPHPAVDRSSFPRVNKFL